MKQKYKERPFLVIGTTDTWQSIVTPKSFMGPPESCSFWSVFRSLVIWQLGQYIRTPHTEMEFFHGSTCCMPRLVVLGSLPLLHWNFTECCAYQSVPYNTCPTVWPSSRSAGTGNWHFFYRNDVELDSRNRKEYFVNIKWKTISSYYIISTEGWRRDDFQCGREELDKSVSSLKSNPGCRKALDHTGPASTYHYSFPASAISSPGQKTQVSLRIFIAPFINALRWGRKQSK